MLLSPTARGLQKQIQICEEYAKNFGMSYNPVKSFCVLFSRKPQNTFSVKLEERELVWRTHAKHLGNYIASDLSEAKEMAYKRSDLVGRVKYTYGQFKRINTRCHS